MSKRKLTFKNKTFPGNHRKNPNGVSVVKRINLFNIIKAPFIISLISIFFLYFHKKHFEDMEINKTSFKLFNLKGIIKSFLTSCQTYLINLPYKI